MTARLVRCAPSHGLAALASMVFASGCGGSSVALPAPQVAASARRVLTPALAPGVKHVFLADAASNVVSIFNREKGLRMLTGFNEPQLLTTDRDASLYVSDTADARIEIFAPPYRNKPTLTIRDSGEAPVDVAVAKDGTVAVINICAGSGSQCRQPGSIYLFANARAASPCATISGGTTISGPLAGAFDASGTLYVDGVNGYTTSRLGVVAGECRATVLTALKPDTAIHFAAGLQVDTHGNIATIDSGAFSRGTSIDVFAAPKPGSKKLELLSQAALNDSGVVTSFALTADGKHLYTAEPHDSLQYAYPQGGYAEGELSPAPSGDDLIEGVAVTPAEIP